MYYLTGWNKEVMLVRRVTISSLRFERIFELSPGRESTHLIHYTDRVIKVVNTENLITSIYKILQVLDIHYGSCIMKLLLITDANKV